ncbi:MAG: DUF3048 domain-containing protein [Candidatus Geothermincolia bacterium]
MSSGGIMRDLVRKSMMITMALLVAGVAVAGVAGCKSSQPPAADDGAPFISEPEPILNPLTGEEVANEALIERRVLAVKVENDPAARPQSGLPQAEIVYEEMVEGNVTRFIALYLANTASVVGPVRSTRPSDVDIIFSFAPLLATSGGAPNVMSAVRASGIMLLEEDHSYFWRDGKRRAPHNLYTSTDHLRKALADWGDAVTTAPSSGLDFMTEDELARANAAGQEQDGEDTGKEMEGPVGLPAARIDVGYYAPFRVIYTYDAASDSYLRNVGGSPNTDLTTGAQVAPRNVIVHYVQLSMQGSTPFHNVIGTGSAVIFKGGKAYQATWRKEGRNSACTYSDSDGEPIELHPGQTWIHLVASSLPVSYN